MPKFFAYTRLKNIPLGIGVLRCLLASVVVFAHSQNNEYMITADVAVQCFFMISGFYMFLILNEKYQDIKMFYLNRILRLFPIYLVVLLISLCIYLFAGDDGIYVGAVINKYWSETHLLTKVYIIFSNILIIFQDFSYFMGLDRASGTLYLTDHYGNSIPKLYHFFPITQSWAISLELYFYILAPFLVRAKLKNIKLIFFVACCIRYYVITKLNYDPYNYRFFPGELVFFLGGGLSFKLYYYLSNLDDQVRFVKYSSSIGIMLSLVIIISIIMFYPITKYLLIKESILYCAFYILTCFALPFIFLTFKDNKFDKKIGDLSYGIYIVHFLAINLIYYIFPNIFNNLYLRPDLESQGYFGYAVLALSIILAMALNILIQNPLEKIRIRNVR